MVAVVSGGAGLSPRRPGCVVVLLYRGTWCWTDLEGRRRSNHGRPTGGRWLRRRRTGRRPVGVLPGATGGAVPGCIVGLGLDPGENQAPWPDGLSSHGQAAQLYASDVGAKVLLWW